MNLHGRGREGSFPSPQSGLQANGHSEGPCSPNPESFGPTLRAPFGAQGTDAPPPSASASLQGRSNPLVAASGDEPLTGECQTCCGPSEVFGNLMTLVKSTWADPCAESRSDRAGRRGPGHPRDCRGSQRHALVDNDLCNVINDHRFTRHKCSLIASCDSPAPAIDCQSNRSRGDALINVCCIARGELVPSYPSSKSHGRTSNSSPTSGGHVCPHPYSMWMLSNPHSSVGSDGRDPYWLVWCTAWT
jgi:hypothetical protein